LIFFAQGLLQMFHPVMPPASQLISELEICFGVGYSAALEMLSYFAV
jgi:hypothetical protein